MRHVKPQNAAVLTRPYETGGRFHLGVSVLLFTTLETPARLLTEPVLWAFWAEQPESEEPLEEGIPRAQAEYLVGAEAHPTDPARGGCRVVAEVGALRKELVVWGERTWAGGRISPPAPLQALRLDWSLAYGGAEYPENPAGRGHVVAPGADRIPLPQVEYPDAPWVRPAEAVRPAGFGPLGILHPRRQVHRGSYDQRWFEEHYPGFPPDLDWRFFNRAPEDQRQPRAFRGDEPYRFVHLHPERPELRGELPGLAVRVFATREGRDRSFEELEMVLRALWFFPHRERLIQVFQGSLPITEDDASDIAHLLTAVERLGRRRPRRHYQQVRDKRLDRDRGLLEALREEDLVPAELAVPLFDPNAAAEPDIGFQRMQARARQEREAARGLVAEHGLDLERHAPPLDAPPAEPPRTLDELQALMEKMDHQMQTALQAAREEKARLLEEAADLLAKEPGFDREQWLAQMKGAVGMPPPEPASGPLIEMLRAQMEAQPPESPARGELARLLEDRERLAHWQRGDRLQAEGYRATSHSMPPPPTRSPEKSAALRETLKERLARGESLAGMDLSGADLAGMRLDGADLREAFLNGADLSAARLHQANLEGATLAHCRLIGTQLSGARLQGANLGRSRIEGADLSEADLSDTVFDGAWIRHARMCRARLDDSRWMDVELHRVDLSGSTSRTMLVFLRLDLGACRLAEVQWAQVVFLECVLRGATLAGARLEKAVFQSVDLQEADLRGLVVENGCFVAGCRLHGSNLRHARFGTLSLRGADLGQCDLRHAVLKGCDLSECDLRGSRLYAADLRGASLARARLQGADLAGCNLMEANLQHAWLEETDLRHANLHASDWARIHLGPGVRTQGSLTTRMRTRPRRGPEGSRAHDT